MSSRPDRGAGLSLLAVLAALRAPAFGAAPLRPVDAPPAASAEVRAPVLPAAAASPALPSQAAAVEAPPEAGAVLSGLAAPSPEAAGPRAAAPERDPAPRLAAAYDGGRFSLSEKDLRHGDYEFQRLEPELQRALRPSGGLEEPLSGEEALAAPARLAAHLGLPLVQRLFRGRPVRASEKGEHTADVRTVAYRGRPAILKVYTKNQYRPRLGYFNFVRELKGAIAYDRLKIAGRRLGPELLGVADQGDGRLGYLMEKIPGGFPHQMAHAIREATIRDVRLMIRTLDRAGLPVADFQYFVTPEGRAAGIDPEFAGTEWADGEPPIKGETAELRRLMALHAFRTDLIYFAGAHGPGPYSQDELKAKNAAYQRAFSELSPGTLKLGRAVYAVTDAAGLARLLEQGFLPAGEAFANPPPPLLIPDQKGPPVLLVIPRDSFRQTDYAAFRSEAPISLEKVEVFYAGLPEHLTPLASLAPISPRSRRWRRRFPVEELTPEELARFGFKLETVDGIRRLVPTRSDARIPWHWKTAQRLSKG